jgi:hypothetical protein
MSKHQSPSADLQKQVLATANACIQTAAQLSIDLRKDPQKVHLLPWASVKLRTPAGGLGNSVIHRHACVLASVAQAIEAACQRLISSEASIARTDKVCMASVMLIVLRTGCHTVLGAEIISNFALRAVTARAAGVAERSGRLGSKHPPDRTRGSTDPAFCSWAADCH